MPHEAATAKDTGQGDSDGDGDGDGDGNGDGNGKTEGGGDAEADGEGEGEDEGDGEGEGEGDLEALTAIPAVDRASIAAAATVDERTAAASVHWALNALPDRHL